MKQYPTVKVWASDGSIMWEGQVPGYIANRVIRELQAYRDLTTARRRIRLHHAPPRKRDDKTDTK